MVRTVCVALAVIGLGSITGAALASRRDWTGTAACGACHPRELAAWRATPHARTRERFATGPDPRRTERLGPAATQPAAARDGESPPRAEPRCLGCHGTGEAPAGPAIAVEVGCEACHGSGAAYAEDDIMRDRPVAVALGLADLSTPEARAALCATCHRTTTRAVAFDSDRAGAPDEPAMKVSARFVTSAADAEDFPPAGHPEVAIVGRSNVGKSSLINALVGQPGLARTSRTPGRTRLVNWFAVDERFYLVDLPGYGYAEVSRAMRDSWRPLIEGYLADRSCLAGVLLLIDIRRGVQDEELDFIPWLARRDMPAVVALTKADKLAKHKRALEVARARQVLGLRRDPVAVSATAREGIDPLWRAVVELAGKARP